MVFGISMTLMSKKDERIEKAIEMFANVFKCHVKEVDDEKINSICLEIVDLIGKNHGQEFPKWIRSKLHNLKGNQNLCQRIYNGGISASEFVSMSSEEMKSEELKNQDELSIKEKILSSRVAECAAETDLFQCSRCKERKCTYSQLQTRSCDEPMTTFVHCTVCGNRWKF